MTDSAATQPSPDLKKNVLIVTSSFAPTATSGVYRSVKFSKYLPEFGWRPHILRVHARRSGAYDPTLLDDVPDCATVHVAKDWGLHGLSSASYKLFGKPVLRSDYGYFTAALRLGKKIVRKKNIDVIFLSAPPDRLPILGLWLKAATGLPLITDFRDPPWQLNSQWKPSETERNYLLDHATRVFAESRFVVANTPAVARRLVEELQLPENKVVTITNGFDDEDFSESFSESNPGNGSDTEKKMVVLHPGQLRNGPEMPFFLDAVRMFLEETPEAKKHVRFEFTGSRAKEFQFEVNRRKLNDVVQIEGHCPHRKTVERMCSANLLLVIAKPELAKLRVFQKIYEFMRAGRPILACIGEGASADLLNKLRMGHRVHPHHPEEIAKALTIAFQKWKSGEPIFPVATPEAMQPYSRRELTRHLAQLLDTASTSQPRNTEAQHA